VAARSLELSPDALLSAHGALTIVVTDKVLLRDGASIHASKDIEVDGDSISLGIKSSVQTTGKITVVGRSASVFYDSSKLLAEKNIQITGGTVSFREGAAATASKGTLTVNATTSVELCAKARLSAALFLSVCGSQVTLETGAAAQSITAGISLCCHTDEDINIEPAQSVQFGKAVSLSTPLDLKVCGGNMTFDTGVVLKTGLPVDLSGDHIIFGNGSTVESHSAMTLTATQVISIGTAAQIKSHSHMTLIAATASIGNDANLTTPLDMLILSDRLSVDSATISAFGDALFSPSSDASNGTRLVLFGNSSISANNTLKLLHASGRVSVYGNVTLTAKALLGCVVVTGQEVFLLDAGSEVVAAFLTVTSFSSATISSNIKNTNPASSAYIGVYVSAISSLTLSVPMGAVWAFQFFKATANSLDIKGGGIRGGTIRTYGDSCNNSAVDLHYDPCMERLTSLQRAGDGIASVAASAPPPVNFDFVLVAQTYLKVWSGARLEGASMLICSGDKTHIGSPDSSHSVAFNAVGRGCTPGQGPGTGEVRNSSERCGAGGGSHIGVGGWGVSSDTQSVNKCAKPGKKYDQFVLGETSKVPTQGASGGGSSSLHDANDGGGGGLIWFHSKQVFYTVNGNFYAQGNDGIKMQTTDFENPEKKEELLSGGSSGGTVLMYVGHMSVPEGVELVVNVRGGNVACGTNMVSGAGGGGFIGLSWLWNTSTFKSMNPVIAQYEGGDVPTSGCPGVPNSGLGVVRGSNGQYSSVINCSSGYHGPLCAICASGRWNPDGGDVCNECTNKPVENAKYEPDAEGWTNSNCPYICIEGVPNIHSNRHCYGALDNALIFFGGMGGIILIVAALFSGFCAVLYRRALRKHQRHKGRVVEWPLQEQSVFDRAGGAVEKGGSSSFLKKIVRKIFCCCCRRREASDDDTVFTSQHLPFHICRIFMFGQNRRSSPWGMDYKCPSQLESLVHDGRWSPFVCAINEAAAVHRSEYVCARLLGILYPPLQPVYEHWCRRKRFALLTAAVGQFSDGLDGNPTIWKPLRPLCSLQDNSGGGLKQRERKPSKGSADPSAACYVTGSGGHAGVIFGSDGGATLGYLDFFDYSRSQLDWAPAEVRRQVRVLVAHGLASYADPLQVDMGDPLVQHLAQGIDNTAVYSVISTFNRVARLVTREELRGGMDTPALKFIQEKVNECATKCGHLDGFVQVLALQQISRAESMLAERSQFAPVGINSFSDLVPKTEPEIRLSHSFRPYSPWHLGRRHAGDATARSCPGGGAADHASPHAERLSDVTNPESLRIGDTANIEVKLCLAFCDMSEMIDRSSGRADKMSMTSASPESTHLLRRSLTSPMTHVGFMDRLTWWEESPEGTLLPQGSLTKARDVAQNTCSCGNVHLPDADFCRKCGAKRIIRAPVLQDSTAFSSGSRNSPAIALREPRGMPAPEFRRLISRDADHRLVSNSSSAPQLPACPASIPITAQDAVRRSVSGRLPAPWRVRLAFRFQGKWSDHTVLLLVVILVCIDAMANVLLAYSLYQLNHNIFALWLLVPPFAQPLAMVMGPCFVLLEIPRLGKIYSMVVLLSMVNAFVSGICRLKFLGEESWVYDGLEFCFVCCLKVMLFCVTNIHIRNLEAAHDDSFGEIPQADLLRGLFHGKISDRTIAEATAETDTPRQAAEVVAAATLCQQSSSSLQRSSSHYNPGRDSLSATFEPTTGANLSRGDYHHSSSRHQPPDHSANRCHDLPPPSSWKDPGRLYSIELGGGMPYLGNSIRPNPTATSESDPHRSFSNMLELGTSPGPHMASPF